MTAARSTAERLADELAAGHTALALQWLERLASLLPLDPQQVFPTDHLLDHIPALISDIAEYLRTPADHQIAANTAVMAKAAELADLRLEQRASVHQLLREYELLTEVLDAFMLEQARSGHHADVAEVLRVQQRVSRAVHSLQRHTVDTFISKYVDTIERQTAQLRGFNRMVSHELRQPLGVLHLLARIIPATVRDEAVRPLADTLDRNVSRLTDVVGKLEQLARLDTQRDTPVTQHVALSALARDAAGQLAEMAVARGVDIRIDDDLPELSVEPARVELVFLNLLANAIKYSDPAKADRFVEVRAVSRVALEVRDNGIGIPRHRLEHIFDAFVRVHEHRDAELRAEGLGLGLSIVRECLDAMGASVEVESREGVGTVLRLCWAAAATA